MIPLFKTKIHSESIDNVTKVLQSGWLGLGPRVIEFESKFADYIGCKHAIALNSCTAALQLAVELANIPKASRVISTANTFVATNHVLLQAGLDPIFADIDLLTGNMDLDSIRRLCQLYGKSVHNTIRPRAIMAVHYGGHPLNLDFLYEIGQEYNLKIIEDCAHACGTQFRSGPMNHYERVGARAKLACFSFHAVKNLPTGDGGMLVTNDDKVAEKARKLRWFGIDKNTSERSKMGYGWEYNVEELGYKLHMNDVMAAMGLGQLSHLDEDNQYRHWIYKQYEKAGLPMLTEFHNTQSSHHLAVMLAKDKEEKEKVIQALTENNIQYGVHYLPNYKYKMYERCVRHNECINTENFYERCISLPNHLYLTEEDVQKIITTIKEVS